MKALKLFSIVMLTLSVPHITYAASVHLDCTFAISNTMPMSGLVNMPKTGDEVVLQIDIDMERQTGTVSGGTTNLYMANPNDPQFTLGITNDEVKFGTVGGGLYLRINRNDLSAVYVLLHSEPFYATNSKGSCIKVKERPQPKGF